MAEHQLHTPLCSHCNLLLLCCSISITSKFDECSWTDLRPFPPVFWLRMSHFSAISLLLGCAAMRISELYIVPEIPTLSLLSLFFLFYFILRFAFQLTDCKWLHTNNLALKQ